MTASVRPAMVAILIGMAACKGGGDEGTMQVSWVYGSDTVALELSATAVSCPDLGWLEVVGASGDTGVGMVVFPEGNQVAGRYAVEPPEWREDSAKSVASIAVRWFSEDGVIAFVASDGVVLLEEAGQSVTGRFVGRLQDLLGVDSLELQGSVSSIPLVVGGIECESPRDSADVGFPTDSGVD
ncbi:MAG: hypothetical protein V3T16_01250 [Gemmatimonadales bacterium]